MSVVAVLNQPGELRVVAVAASSTQVLGTTHAPAPQVVALGTPTQMVVGASSAPAPAVVLAGTRGRDGASSGAPQWRSEGW